MSEFNYDVKHKLKTKVTTVSLSDSPKYKTKVRLENLDLNLLCHYNTRNRLRWITITTVDGTVLLPQTFLSANKKCELNFNAELLGLYYNVTLVPNNQYINLSDYDYLEWGYDFNLVFRGYSNEIRKVLDKNTVSFLVGG